MQDTVVLQLLDSEGLRGKYRLWDIEERWEYLTEERRWPATGNEASDVVIVPDSEDEVSRDDVSERARPQNYIYLSMCVSHDVA